MTDYIGAKLSLISKSDIRYVGTLHEIDSKQSTVSLEQVRSFGTEGRKGDPALEIPASDNVFEYIIFRGSDVKDLRVEQSGGSAPSPPPARSQDPAIVQSGPVPGQQSHQPQQSSGPFDGPPRGFDGPRYGMPPPPQNYGYGYPPPPHHHHQQQYNGPPQGYGYPPQSAQAPFQPQQNQGPFAPQPQNAFPELPANLKQSAAAQAPGLSAQSKAPEKPTQAKIVPALPLPTHAPSPKPKASKDVEQLTADVGKLSTLNDAATGPTTNGQQPPKRNALLDVARNMKPSSQPSTQSNAAPAPAAPAQQRHEERAPRGRRSPPAGRRDPGIRQNGVIVNPSSTIVIPSSEYDFSSANAKFSREGLSSDEVKPVYNKSSSFFDSISSEATDRSAAQEGAGRGRGREARNQERTMNYETFGEDLAFTGPRGRGRGRGRGGRGRGRGGRGNAQAGTSTVVSS